MHNKKIPTLRGSGLNLLKQEALKKFVTPGNLMCSSPYPQFFSLTRKYS
ncbi:hypothetical protein G3810_000559 [Escherichia coli]|uniref:Uncharacterized protein n=1 Tax=Escherichia coli TaxID=562 RepID=A0A2H4TYJ2_ECOLX|nr:hypothetical protein CV83915_04355 [Escherichia coli]AWF11536.1 hypothetical protein CSC24_3439 [Escherichia coli]EFI4022824.1 hypothetical protein [Escherichia coli]EFI8258205.1 hypothetical protein [Escherichia coli]EFI9549031.1 hypothetical protein [Escherichia coli]